jgi:pentatricopeptide repeat protein
LQCSVLTQLAKLHQPDRALATFVWFEQSPQYNISGCLLYTRMISILSRHKRFQAHAVRLFDRMLARRILPDLMCFNAAINAAGEATTLHPCCASAACVLTWLCSLINTLQTIVSRRRDANRLLSAGKAMQYNRVQQLFQQLQQRGYRPNVYTYTSLIAACQRAGRWQEAWQAFEDMEAAGMSAVGHIAPHRTLRSAAAQCVRWGCIPKLESAGSNGCASAANPWPSAVDPSDPGCVQAWRPMC